MSDPIQTISSAGDAPACSFAKLWRHTPSYLRASIRRAVAQGLRALRSPPPLTLAQWAHRYFFLSAESSQQQGAWRAYPFQAGLLDAMGHDEIREVTVRKSARVGYTKCLLALIAYNAQHKRRNQLVFQPTDADSDDFCKTELEPMLRDVEVMREVFPKVLAKSKTNTLQQKKFLGSILKLRGGTSAGNYRRHTVQAVLMDELDGFDQKVEKSSDPWTLASKRLEGATWPKMVCGTTPRVRGLSHIERREAAAHARMRYHIACPHCQADHPLEWGRGGETKAYGFKWDAADPEASVRHHCPHCLQPIEQAQYLACWQDGEWVSDCGRWRLRNLAGAGEEPRTHWLNSLGEAVSPPEHVAFHIWTAYSPQATWAQIVREFIAASAAAKRGDTSALAGFVNETLGETWEEQGERADPHTLQNRAEAYRLRSVPQGGLMLVAGVDVQDNRFEMVTWAIGRGLEAWAVDYQVIDANPADARDWTARLWPAITATYRHAGGKPMGLRGVAIDTGGHFTHQAYQFVHGHATPNGPRLFAVKGSSQPGQPIKSKIPKAMDITLAGRVLRRGVKLWMVGTDTAKDLFFGMLKVTQPGPGRVHFSRELPADFYHQLTAEQRVLVRSAAQGQQYRWVLPGGARNETLDCTVYSLFTAMALGLDRYTDDDWQRVERTLTPDLADLAALAAAQASTGHEDAEDLDPVERDEDPAEPGAPSPGKPAVRHTRPRPDAPNSQQKPVRPAATSNSFASGDWLQRM